MKATIKIPAGWRRVPATSIRKGDRWLSTLGRFCWAKYEPQFGTAAYRNCIVIRRIARAKKTKFSDLVEVSIEERDRLNFSPSVYRYTDKTGKGHMTHDEWMRRIDLRIMDTRFFLRKGAK